LREVSRAQHNRKENGKTIKEARRFS
jgi:hypothetical protein